FPGCPARTLRRDLALHSSAPRRCSTPRRRDAAASAWQGFPAAAEESPPATRGSVPKYSAVGHIGTPAIASHRGVSRNRCTEYRECGRCSWATSLLVLREAVQAAGVFYPARC